MTMLPYVPCCRLQGDAWELLLDCRTGLRFGDYTAASTGRLCGEELTVFNLLNDSPASVTAPATIMAAPTRSQTNFTPPCPSCSSQGASRSLFADCGGTCGLLPDYQAMPVTVGSYRGCTLLGGSSFHYLGHGLASTQRLRHDEFISLHDEDRSHLGIITW